MGKGSIAQIDVRCFATKIIGNSVVIERVGRSYRVRVPAELLNRLRRPAAFPHPNEPQRVEPAMRQRRQLFVRNLVKPADLAPILPAQLRQPYISTLRDQNRT